jgi:hypothetical protein
LYVSIVFSRFYDSFHMSIYMFIVCVNCIFSIIFLFPYFHLYDYCMCQLYFSIIFWFCIFLSICLLYVPTVFLDSMFIFSFYRYVYCMFPKVCSLLYVLVFIFISICLWYVSIVFSRLYVFFIFLSICLLYVSIVLSRLYFYFHISIDMFIVCFKCIFYSIFIFIFLYICLLYVSIVCYWFYFYFSYLYRYVYCRFQLYFSIVSVCFYF